MALGVTCEPIEKKDRAKQKLDICENVLNICLTFFIDNAFDLVHIERSLGDCFTGT